MLGTNKILALEHNFSLSLLNFINSVEPSTYAEIITKRKAERIETERIEADREEQEKFAWAGSVTINGVAYIKVKGPILSDEDGWIYYYHANVVGIKLLIENALNDAAVWAIVLVSDSPGGEITGVHELASYIYQARQKKLMIAYAEGDFCSAMYWFGSACHFIVADPTAQIGSIGTVIQFVDRTEQLKKNGIKVWSMVASQSPNKRVDPTKDPGKKMYQTMLDETADVFLNDVAMYRGTTPDALMKAGNYGFVRVGRSALEHGLCDAISTKEQLTAALNQEKDPARIISLLNSLSSAPLFSNSVTNSNQGEDTMEFTQEQTEQLQKYAKMGLALTEAIKLMDLEDLSEEDSTTAEGIFQKAQKATKNQSGSEMESLTEQMINLAEDIGLQKDELAKLASQVSENQKQVMSAIDTKQAEVSTLVSEMDTRVKKLERDEQDEDDQDITGASNTGKEFAGTI